MLLSGGSSAQVSSGYDHRGDINDVMLPLSQDIDSFGPQEELLDDTQPFAKSVTHFSQNTL